MNALTPAARASLYNLSGFGRRYPASQLSIHLDPTTGREWVHGVWFLGNDYRVRSGYYGGYPASYLPRVLTMFPEYGQSRPGQGTTLATTLHAFAGGVEPSESYARIDLNLTRASSHDIAGEVCSLPDYFAEPVRRFVLTLADPPYGPRHAARYGTPMVDRRKATAALAAVTVPGGQMVWLDTKFPMFRKAEWSLWGCIMVVRSTNHDVRGAFLFERV